MRRTSRPVDAGIRGDGTVRGEGARRGDGARRGPYYPDDIRPLRAPWDPTESSRRRAVDGGSARGADRGSWIVRFVRTWGWRAYAIPVLAVLTVVVIVQAVTGAGTVDATDDENFGVREESSAATDVLGAPTGDGARRLVGDESARLPGGGPFAADGAREWHVVPGTAEQVGRGSEKVYTYTVEVENGIDTSGVGGDEAFARMVDATLADPRGWIHDERFGFRRIDEGNPDFRVSLTAAKTVREICGYEIELESSCFNPNFHRVVINDARWIRGAKTFRGDIGSYRQYVLNHEIGHAVGYAEHRPCHEDGALAPIMMQQTFGLRNKDIFKLDEQSRDVPDNEDTCRFNPWPYPEG